MGQNYFSRNDKKACLERAYITHLFFRESGLTHWTAPGALVSIAAFSFGLFLIFGSLPGLVEGSHQGLLLIEQGSFDFEDPSHVHLFETGDVFQRGVADDVHLVAGGG